MFDGCADALSDLLCQFQVGLVEMPLRFGKDKGDRTSDVAIDDEGNGHERVIANGAQGSERLLVSGEHLIGKCRDQFRLSRAYHLLYHNWRVRVYGVLLAPSHYPFNPSRVFMGNFEQVDVAIIVEQVNGTPVGQCWHYQTNDTGKRRLVIERGGKDSTRFTEEARPLFRLLALGDIAMHNKNAHSRPVPVAYQRERHQDIERRTVAPFLDDLALPAAALLQRLSPFCSPARVIGHSAFYNLDGHFADDLFSFPAKELFSGLVPAKKPCLHIRDGHSFGNVVETCQVEEFRQIVLHARCIFPGWPVLCSAVGLRIHAGKSLIRAITVGHVTKTPSPGQDTTVSTLHRFQQVHIPPISKKAVEARLER